MATQTEDPRPQIEDEPHQAETPEEEEGGPVKPFLEHLEDLRWVLIKSGVALFLGMIVCLIAGNKVVDLLKRPLNNAKVKYPAEVQVITALLGTNRLGVFQISTNQRAAYNLPTNQVLALQIEPKPVGSNEWALTMRIDPKASAEIGQKMQIDLINLGPVGGFVVALQVAFYGGMVLAAPFIFFFVAQFVFPALKMKEKKYVYRGLGFGSLLFGAGVGFCYFALMPLALAVSQQYSQWLGFAATQWRAEEYIKFVCKFMLGMGLGFELPVVILTLVKIGVLNYRILSKARRYMIVINLLLGAVLTTPEVITQVMMFIPLQLLYEASVWIAWYWERQDRKRAQAAMGV
ncbi:MAG: twin-arginine translocase subunit TatC [Verrucomicrobia subdivision 3 bacterium]|nr:twin-arginine translocase subunit TatC [Limisphaerales bacterium]